MGIQNWITKQPTRIREEGIYKAATQNFKEVSEYTLQKIEPLDPRGTSIYEKEWDVLIILDACRVDTLQAIASEYDFLPDHIEKSRSLASASRTWMDRNFTEKNATEMQKTAYVTSNPYSESHINEEDFHLVDEVWEYGWDDDLGTVPARNVTDRAIDVSRHYRPDRLLIHYMQPHFPSVTKPLGSEIDINTFGENWNSIWDQIANGEIKEEVVKESYEENLRYVLDDVEILLNNIDAEKVVISADHGNAFGEWGYYGHPPHIPISAIRNVPWVETTAVDHKDYDPTFKREEESITNQEVQSRLEDLGYL